MSSYNYKCLTVEPRGTFIPDTTTRDNSFWQSPLWAEILRDTHQARDILLCDDGKAKVLIERRSIVGRYTGLYILGIQEKLVTQGLLSHIQENIAQESDLFLQIEPIDDIQESKKGAAIGKKAPFRRFIEPITAILDLENTTEEKLFQSFAEKGRYNIRLAQKRGVTTRWVKGYERYSATGKTYIEEFFGLLEETTQRDRFSHNRLDYYRFFVETLEAHDAGGLLIAEKDGILHAAGIFVYWNDMAIYYYGASASDRDIRRDMATYLLQWDAIRTGIERKCRTYDFLGIASDGKWKLAGVTEFKLRFNPEKKEWPKEHVIIYRSLLLKALQWASRIRKMIR